MARGISSASNQPLFFADEGWHISGEGGGEGVGGVGKVQREGEERMG